MMKTRNDLLREASRYSESIPPYCGELPRVLWWDEEGRAHYSIPSPSEKPSPSWLGIAVVFVVVLSVLLSLEVLLSRGF